MFRSQIFILLSFVFTTFFSPLSSVEKHELKVTDIRNLMEEMFSYHVETKEMGHSLVKRSFKIFLDQFDVQKIYLTKSEAKPYLELAISQIEAVINHFYSDDYTEFENLNRLFEQAIYRAQRWRQEFYTDFIKHGNQMHIERVDQSFQYVNNTDLLRKRLRFQLYQNFLTENRLNDPQFWTLERREKICHLFEKRFAHYENTYLLSKENHKHYFALHILKALSRGLDAHTAFFSREEAFEMRFALEKQFEGFGVVLRESIDGIEITHLVKGSPAARSGKIQIGDYLVEIDGKSIVNASYQEVLQQLKGDGNAEVALGIRHSSKNTEEQLFKVALKREKILMENERLIYSFEPYQDGIIGKFILPSFYESSNTNSCETDIREALRELKKKGKLLGLVIDIRNNLGGFLSQAVKVAGLFMTSGVVVISKYAQGEIQYLRHLGPQAYYKGPLVLMTSKMSASAAEIVAQSLQDYGVALVVGDERTYGKGTIQYQTVTNPKASSFFKVTVGKYYTVSGRSTQILGVAADIVVPTSFSPYPIGERYLEYALQNDQVPSVYMDTLHDITAQNKQWFQNHYLRYLQKKDLKWIKILPKLKSNSQERLIENSDFKNFHEQLDQYKEPVEPKMDDLQMKESINILKDMINQKIA